MRTLLADLGDPHLHLRAIHIAGSKGKGSTALYVERLLEHLGYSSFTFTSPHLERWTERLRLNGAEADAERAREAIDAVRAASARTGVRPGFFEALTVAAFWLAHHAGVDWCVIECGVGGRADATNVLRPAVTAITSIELEHTDRLGPTRAAIAREKAGIVNPGAPLIAPELPAELDAVLANAARAADVPFVRVRPDPGDKGRTPAAGDVHWRYAGGLLTLTGADFALTTPMASPGPHMAVNAAIAATLVAQLGLVSGPALERAFRAIAETALPGRLEILSSSPWLMVDGAHTPASAEALATAVRVIAPPRVHLLLSCSTSKSLAPTLTPLLALADAVTTTCADPEYSFPAETLAQRVHQLAPHLPVSPQPTPARALARVRATMDDQTLILATGSVYLAGAVRHAFYTPGATAV